jgi:hypothetical protein
MGTHHGHVWTRRHLALVVAVTVTSLGIYALSTSSAFSDGGDTVVVVSGKVNAEVSASQVTPPAAPPTSPATTAVALLAPPPTPAPPPPTTTTPPPAPPPVAPVAPRSRDQRCHDAIAAVGRSPATGFGVACGNGYNTGTDGHTSYWCSEVTIGSTCTGTAYIHPDDGDPDSVWRQVVRYEIAHTYCIRDLADFTEACAGP